MVKLVDGQPSIGCGRAVGVAIIAAHYVCIGKTVSSMNCQTLG